MFRLDYLSCLLTVLALQDGSKPQKSRYRSLFRVLAGAPREKLELDNASMIPFNAIDARNTVFARGNLDFAAASEMARACAISRVERSCT
jgi:hypothetical protein